VLCARARGFDTVTVNLVICSMVRPRHDLRAAVIHVTPPPVPTAQVSMFDEIDNDAKQTERPRRARAKTSREMNQERKEQEESEAKRLQVTHYSVSFGPGKLVRWCACQLHHARALAQSSRPQTGADLCCLSSMCRAWAWRRPPTVPCVRSRCLGSARTRACR
jgi:hypothetical protein